MIGRYLLGFVVCFLALSTSAHAAVCQQGTAIVFGNGVYTSEGQARVATRFTEIRLRLHTIGTVLETEPIEFSYAYTDNAGATNIATDTDSSQLLELFKQKVAESSIDMFWAWLFGQSQAPDWFKEKTQDLAIQVNGLAYVNDPDLQAHKAQYRTYLNAGKRVVIVAHSQGNFYANAAYDQLTTENPVWTGSFSIVGVGTPASRVAGGGQYVTAFEDVWMERVRNLFSNTLPANINTLGAQLGVGPVSFGADPDGHSFVKFYLYELNITLAILNHIVTTIGGLQYAPQNCQQPVPWQKVLSHDWDSWNNGYGSLIRRIRDDANEWLFTAQYSISSQSVSIVLNAFDDSLSVTLPSYRLDGFYPYPLPQGVLMPGSFLGFVPIPNGVGVLFETHIVRVFTEVFPEGVQAAPAEIGDTFITLVSHVWDKASGAWATMPNTIQLPTYDMAVVSFGLKTVAVSNYNCSGSTSALGHAPVQFDVNRSWVLCAGIKNDLLINGTYLNWAIVTVDSGVINASYNVTDIGGSYWSFLNPLQVDVPTGLYSSLYEALNPTSSSIKVGTVSLGASDWLAPLPRVGTGSILDQRIIGGGDSYISGQGVQSAPGYYDHHVLAIDSAVGLHNSVGQKHPTLLGGGRLNSGGEAIATTPEDLLFFQW